MNAPYFARDRVFYHTLFRLILVVSLQNILAYSVNVADNIMLGSYSQAALSGAATVNQVQFLVQQITIAMGDAMVMLNAQYRGKGDVDPIRCITGITLKTGLAFGLLVLLITALLPHQLLGLFTSDPEIIHAGVEYLSILKYSYLFYVLTTILIAFLRSLEVVTISFAVSLMSLIVNVAINYTLIFGHFGFPELGLKGAAIGTLTARILELTVVVLYVLLRESKFGSFTGIPSAVPRSWRRTIERLPFRWCSPICFGAWPPPFKPGFWGTCPPTPLPPTPFPPPCSNISRWLRSVRRPLPPSPSEKW